MNSLILNTIRRAGRSISLATCGLAFTASIAAQQPQPTDPAYLESLRNAVRTNHPTATAARQRVQAAKASIRSVRLWDDPMVGLGLMAAEREMRQDDGDLMFMVEQVLPRPSLYAARKTKARSEYSMAQAEARSAVLNLETLATQSALELALLDEMIAIQTNQVDWISQITVNAREKLNDPAASASEPLRIESELAQERLKLDAALRTRLRFSQQLNILLGRPPAETWPPLRLPESADLTPFVAGDLNRILESNPMLQGLLSAADAARAELEVARRERKPIFSVGAGSSLYSGGDFRQATVTAKMSLPLFNRSVYRANIERAQHQQQSAELEIDALQRKLQGEAISAQTEAENSAQQAVTFTREVIPRAQQAAQSIQNAWVLSKATLLEVLEARRALLNAQLEQRRAVASQLAALETLRSIIPPPNHSKVLP